jgi:hypothetical protein
MWHVVFQIQTRYVAQHWPQMAKWWWKILYDFVSLSRLQCPFSFTCVVRPPCFSSLPSLRCKLHYLFVPPLSISLSLWIPIWIQIYLAPPNEDLASVTSDQRRKRCHSSLLSTPPPIPLVTKKQWVKASIEEHTITGGDTMAIGECFVTGRGHTMASRGWPPYRLADEHLC